jgi:hypothetical protein
VTKLEERLTHVLATRSADAPPADGLAQAARSRQLRRRRAQLGGAVVALVAVLVPAGVIGHLLTRHDPSEPEPLGPPGPYTYGQHQNLSDAVPAAQAPGFKILDYGVPSHSPEIPLSSGEILGETPEYLDVDANGRLTAMRLHGPTPTVSYQLVPGPGRPAHEIPDPVGGSVERGIWWPMFTPDSRLLWSNGPSRGLHDPLWISDADGGDSQPIVPPQTEVPANAVNAAYRGNLWVEGGRVWFSAVTKVDGPDDDQTQWVSLYSYDPADPQQVRRETPADASAIDVASGEAVWIDEGDTKVFAEDLTSHEVHQVPVPLDDGCRLVPTLNVSSPGSEAIVTNGSLIAVTELCPDWRTSRVIVTDLSGRLVTDIDPGRGNQIYDVVLSEQTIAFVAQRGEGGGSGDDGDGHTTYLDDLGTGELVDLGNQVPNFDTGVQVAGRYVLWYAGPAGHVGRLTAH